VYSVLTRTLSVLRREERGMASSLNREVNQKEAS